MQNADTRYSTVAAIRRDATRRLRAAGRPEAARDADVLLAWVLGRERTDLLAHPEAIVPAEAAAAIAVAVDRRAAAEPVQYITGERDFWRDTFRVTRAVLIPRPETELLVEKGADALRTIQAPSILDLATGSGCVGLSLLRELPRARLVATDRSPAALEVARGNADRLGVAARAAFVCGDGLTFLRAGSAGEFHLIVANPPYVSRGDLELLPAEVRDWEPRLALDGGTDGLDCYRAWVPPALALLLPGGRLLMEFGYGQWPALSALLASMGCDAAMFPDLAGIPRVFQIGRG
ncbi:MAG TPA: peptide chain release factor N(5)-glutamine methyltransferase [Acidobacteriota bacterium]|nr:peptide chain release factor N(5)-glutamine methyltransferase [Acidobacteriota bacterium]HQF86046.1 peptide chain release factor N(5)-glutamine methyltransferase [Acidobacteriota bacterium]HQG90711.1 peptide chain release factor N(5)-glutamine methyltransferase [Acidobacteriota bacterium]